MESLMQVGKATASDVWRGLFCVLSHTQLQICLVLPCSNPNSAYLHMQAADWKQTFHPGKTEKQRSSYAKKIRTSLVNVVHSSSAHAPKQSLSRHQAQVGCQEVRAAVPYKNMLAPQRGSQGVKCSTFSYINPSFSQTSDTKNLRTTFSLFFWMFFTFQLDTIWTLLNGVYRANPESSLDNITSNHSLCHLKM